MTGSVDYTSYVEPVRAELKKLAAAGKVTYYKDLGQQFGKPARWSQWKSILDAISQEKPDISIVVLNSKSGWPGQIDYTPTEGKPTAEQKQFAQEELARVFGAHCSGKPVPQLPIKRKR